MFLVSQRLETVLVSKFGWQRGCTYALWLWCNFTVREDRSSSLGIFNFSLFVSPRSEMARIIVEPCTVEYIEYVTYSRILPIVAEIEMPYDAFLFLSRFVDIRLTTTQNYTQRLARWIIQLFYNKTTLNNDEFPLEKLRRGIFLKDFQFHFNEAQRSWRGLIKIAKLNRQFENCRLWVAERKSKEKQDSVINHRQTSGAIRSFDSHMALL